MLNTLLMKRQKMTKVITKYDLINRSMTIDLLSIISNMDITKEQKEDLALKAMMLTKEDARVIWKDDRIEGIRLNKGIEKIELTIVINKNGEIEVDGKPI